MRQAEQRKSGYLPGLDGLRAFAILGVLAAHDLPWSFAGYSNAKWKGYGGWGVDLFFALSGVLICWRLLEDEAEAGKISLRAFYVRRLLRIQPAALAYLSVVASLFFAGAIPVTWRFWWSAIFSYTNFLITPTTAPSCLAFLGHFWTLSVEEHFYVLISLLFLSSRRYRGPLLGIVLATLLGIQSYEIARGHMSFASGSRRTYAVLQFLFFPALLALLVRVPKVKVFVVRFGKPWAATVFIVSVMCLHVVVSGTRLMAAQSISFSPLFFVAYNMDLLFYGFGIWIIAIMLHPESLTTRFLELPVLRFVGRLSYSLYLWHILFFIPAFLPTQIHSSLLLALVGRPWKYLGTAGAALLSYYLIEKPFIRLGHRLAPPATAGHEDLDVPEAEDVPELMSSPSVVQVLR